MDGHVGRWIGTWIDSSMHACMHTYMLTYTHIHIHTHTYIHIYLYLCVCVNYAWLPEPAGRKYMKHAGPLCKGLGVDAAYVPEGPSTSSSRNESSKTMSILDFGTSSLNRDLSGPSGIFQCFMGSPTTSVEAQRW